MFSNSHNRPPHDRPRGQARVREFRKAGQSKDADKFFSALRGDAKHHETALKTHGDRNVADYETIQEAGSHAIRRAGATRSKLRELLFPSLFGLRALLPPAEAPCCFHGSRIPD